MQHWNFFRVQELIGIGEDIQFQHDNDAGRIIVEKAEIGQVHKLGRRWDNLVAHFSISNLQQGFFRRVDDVVRQDDPVGERDERIPLIVRRPLLRGRSTRTR